MLLQAVGGLVVVSVCGMLFIPLASACFLRNFSPQIRQLTRAIFFVPTVFVFVTASAIGVFADTNTDIQTAELVVVGLLDLALISGAIFSVANALAYLRDEDQLDPVPCTGRPAANTAQEDSS